MSAAREAGLYNTATSGYHDLGPASFLLVGSSSLLQPYRAAEAQKALGMSLVQDDAAAAASLPTDSRSGIIIAVVAVLLPIATTLVCLRFYVRSRMIKYVGPDDWMSLVSLVFAIIDGVVICLMTRTGLGRHAWTVSSEDRKIYSMEFYLSIVFYCACLGATKMALLLQYYRIFAVMMQKVTLVAMFLIGGWSLSVVLVSIFICNPVEGFWDSSLNAKCIQVLPNWYIQAAGNILTDLIIFTLPIPVLWKLRLPTSQRLSLIGVFAFGVFTCAISVYRIHFLNLSDDDTYENIGAAGWSIGELCSGIICSCLPTLRPLFFHLLPGLQHQHRDRTDIGYIKQSELRSCGVVGGTDIESAQASQINSSGQGSFVDLNRPGTLTLHPEVAMQITNTSRMMSLR